MASPVSHLRRVTAAAVLGSAASVGTAAALAAGAGVLTFVQVAAASVLLAVVVPLVLDRAVFRPLRTHSPAVMLVTTFAIAFVLQAIALVIDIRDDTIGEVAASVASLNQAVTVAGGGCPK